MYIIILSRNCFLFGTDQSEAFLVISNRRSILIADLQQRNLERVPVLVENVVATASDMKNGTLFWSDMKVKQIVKLEKGGQPEVVSQCFMSFTLVLYG